MIKLFINERHIKNNLPHVGHMLVISEFNFYVLTKKFFKHKIFNKSLNFTDKIKVCINTQL